MAIEDDVLVIGGGLAGATAALAAADRGAQVRLVSAKQSTLRHASGLIDVLGYAPAGDGPLADPFAALEDLPAGHPYERVGGEAVREALSFFDEIAGDAYEGGHTDANALVPTHGGTVKPTARYPASTADGLASDDRDALLVGFETLPDFDAPLAASHLKAAGAPFEARGVTVRFPGIVRDDAKITRYAHLLDQPETVRTDRGETTAREALAAVVEPHLEGEPRVGFPAVLGDDHADAVRADLGDRLGVDVFEVPMGPPSLPGMRLEDLLYDALAERGVRVTTGVPVVDYETAADGPDGNAPPPIDHVIVDRNGTEIPHRADQYVLATGGLVGKGVESERGRVFEPIFDCHVPHAADRYDWFVDDVFGDQPYAQFGLPVDRDLRPLDADDGLEFPNLRGAGAVLGGYDFAAEKSGAGVSLATGYVAGQRAAEERQ
ncbi:glycerol-3-phosphate dehydrogenase subunit GlpB [Natrinema versiforme]|uniref:Anaerobic glycerol-3-phosphate dehydrogenase subunit B n=1 Tax=Natrinema versiforme JCM 10478 TaxID=1227496 RepID=L9Y3K0_9EURY|nr:glycerol-3-phosphate dehydrogenase subunit GlpB [Natrinema versiforme]ELY67453.1 anaerobic glycerol-3-phosphate dehydrogenase subunit B [Natrinema versiforme JCM 10478]